MVGGAASSVTHVILGSAGSRACCDSLPESHHTGQEALGLESCPRSPGFTHRRTGDQQTLPCLLMSGERSARMRSAAHT